MNIKKTVYYQKETRAAIKNFPFSVPSVSLVLVRSIVEIKRSAALAAGDSGLLDNRLMKAIVRACDEILSGKLNNQFVTPSFQGGAGTSLHMNVNEVIAGVATRILGGKIIVHPNDHVNIGQSTNDVVPSAFKIALVRQADEVLKSARKFISVLHKKATEFKGIKKLGRTHLQDAVPITLGFEFLAYAALIERDCRRLVEAKSYLYDLFGRKRSG